MYDAETDFNLLMNRERLSKFVIHYELYKMTKKIKGSIVECGVFKGTSFSRFSMLREMFEDKKKLIAFDVFSSKFPNTNYKNEKKQREHWIKTAGPSSITKKQLKSLFKKKGVKNFELVSGDILKTLPEYKKKKPKIKDFVIKY